MLEFGLTFAVAYGLAYVLDRPVANGLGTKGSAVQDTKEKPKTDDPLGPAHRCLDFDEDCKGVPDPGRVFRSHLNCWLYQPERGWCPFLKN